MNDVMAAPEFKITYDRLSDVVYVTTRPGAPARSREGLPGVVWRYDAHKGDLIGVTIVDFKRHWYPRRQELASQIAGRFTLPLREAKALIDRMDA